MNIKKVLGKRDFVGFESLNDIEDWLWDVINYAEVPGEFLGTIKITVEYEYEEDNE